jgi:hypothetical protein
MEKQLPRIPRKMIETHFEWVRRYKLNSIYYLNFFARREALVDYFNFAMNPRFKKLNEIPESELTQYYAQRTVEHRNYSLDGKTLILPETIGKMELIDPQEILVYELSSGKLTIGRMAREFITETGNELSTHEIVKNIFLPVFKKLEDNYQVVFY